MVMTAVEDQRNRERWRYVGVLVGGLALLVALGIQLILLIPTTYTATSAVALRPLTAEQTAETIEMQAHEFSVLLGAKETAAEVIDSMDSSDHRPDVGVTATLDAGTSTIRVETTSTDKDAAIAVANGLADKAERLGQGDQTAKVVVLVQAGPSGVTSDPPRSLYIAALLALTALLLAGGLYRIRERTS
jgi:capsular polysaccharide biosynthesis protein